jgi:hypothetical protein
VTDRGKGFGGADRVGEQLGVSPIWRERREMGEREMGEREMGFCSGDGLGERRSRGGVRHRGKRIAKERRLGGDWGTAKSTIRLYTIPGLGCQCYFLGHSAVCGGG